MNWREVGLSVLKCFKISLDRLFNLCLSTEIELLNFENPNGTIWGLLSSRFSQYLCYVIFHVNLYLNKWNLPQQSAAYLFKD